MGVIGCAWMSFVYSPWADKLETGAVAIKKRMVDKPSAAPTTYPIVLHMSALAADSSLRPATIWMYPNHLQVRARGITVSEALISWKEITDIVYQSAHSPKVPQMAGIIVVTALDRYEFFSEGLKVERRMMNVVAMMKAIHSEQTGTGNRSDRGCAVHLNL